MIYLFMCYQHVKTTQFRLKLTEYQSRILDLHLSISNDIVSTKMYDKRDDFDFEIVNFPFLDGDVPCTTSY